VTKLVDKVAQLPNGADQAKENTKEEMVTLIIFDNMPLWIVLDFYSDLTGRVVLRSQSLPITTFISLKSRGPLTKTDAITALESVMALNGIVVIPTGDKFVFVVVEGLFESAAKVAEKLLQALAQPAAANAPEMIPVINFSNLPLPQACAFYAELAGKKLDETQKIPNIFISFKSGFPITKAEAIAALDAVFGLNGVEVVPEGENRLRVLINGQPAPKRDTP